MKFPMVRAILLFLISINLLCSSLFLSWQFNRSADYFYPVFYKQLNMSQHIDRYSPWNQQRKNYHTVGEAEHVRVFSELVDMVHGHGIGLQELKYYAQDGTVIDKVLVEDEVSHMQEVANLVAIATWFGLASLALTMFVIYLSLRKKIIWPTFKYISTVSMVGVAIMLALMAMIGFSKLFYEFHVLVFSEAPWIFAYNESLLVLLTKTPQFFGVMAACIFFPALLFFIFFMFCLCRYQDRHD